MRHPQLVILEYSGRFASLLRELAEERRWTLHESRQDAVVLRQLRRGAPAVLVLQVGQHLERSQLVLAELVNLESKHRADIAPERAVARNLADENRLYRQTAQAAGDTRITSVLDDLERVLVEIANSPEEPTAAQLDVLRQRIESEGLLFKVRVVRSRLREQATPKIGTTKL